MKKFVFALIGLALAIGACAPATPVSTPLPTPDMAATADVLAKTMVAETLAAMPTDTPLPTNTPLPTDTPTQAVTDTETPTATFTPTITLTAEPFTGMFAPGGTPNDGRKGFIRAENNTDFTPVTIVMDGVSANGNDPIYVAYVFDAAILFEVPFGSYKYRITIANKATHEGSVRINNKDKTTFRIYLNKVNVVGP